LTTASKTTHKGKYVTTQGDEKDMGKTENKGMTKENAGFYFVLNAPATSERLRLACFDGITSVAAGPQCDSFQPLGSW